MNVSQVLDGSVEYINLDELIQDWSEFIPEAYVDGEQQVIKPQLEELGYTEISFYTIDREAGEPLLRGVSFMKRDGDFETGVYGLPDTRKFNW